MNIPKIHPPHSDQAEYKEVEPPESTKQLNYLIEVLKENSALYRTSLFLVQGIENDDFLCELAWGLGINWNGIKGAGHLGLLFNQDIFEFKTQITRRSFAQKRRAQDEVACGGV